MPRSFRIAGLAILTFGTLGLFVAWLLLGGPADRAVERMFAEALRETRTRAVLSGRPHLLVLTSSTMEIREESDDRVLRRMSIPGATLRNGPAWIRLDSTGSARLPPAFFGGLRAERDFDGWGSDPMPIGDVVYAFSPRRHFYMNLDLASGRVDQACYLADEPASLASRLFSWETLD
ncbi:MAG TPA: hypothetical protein VF950_18015 [Planctomycetota bacterium]